MEMYGGRNPGLGLAVLRIVLGVVFLAHGVPELLAGAERTRATLELLDVSLPWPFVAAWAIVLLETIGGACLLLGIFVAPAAFLLAGHMLAGLFLVHLPAGFYVIGRGQGGIEFNLVLAAALLAVLFAGPGIGTLASRFQKDIRTE